MSRASPETDPRRTYARRLAPQFLLGFTIPGVAGSELGVVGIDVVVQQAPGAENLLPPAPEASCARFRNGSVYISNRRGVSSRACGQGFDVHFPDHHELSALRCDQRKDWAGYVCTSQQSRMSVVSTCPAWNETLPCDLGDLEPCHPHSSDAGCAAGLNFHKANDTCPHKCKSGFVFDSSAGYAPTCPSPGSVLAPPPCNKKCEKDPSEHKSTAFSINCGSKPPGTVRERCEVVSSLWTQQCNTAEATCDTDLEKITCVERTCPADITARGVHEETPIGKHVVPMCPSGFYPTVGLIHCGETGWSHENICRPGRNPRLKISRSPCVNGRQTTTTLIMDLGFPPMNTGLVPSTKQTACTLRCCNNGGIFASEEVKGVEGCKCVLSRFGFSLDPGSDATCCRPPADWDRESAPQFRNSHRFPEPVVAISCLTSPCTLSECLSEPAGCLAFSAFDLYVRNDAPNLPTGSQAVQTATNVVVIEYIFA